MGLSSKSGMSKYQSKTTTIATNYQIECLLLDDEIQSNEELLQVLYDPLQLSKAGLP